MHRRPIYLAWFCTHLILVLLVSARDTLRLITHQLTVLPAAVDEAARTGEHITAAALALNLPTSNPLRRTVLTYLDAAGIDRPYSYFAPNVPDHYRLVLELHYADGRTEYELPAITDKATGLRLASLLEEIANTPSSVLREYLIKMLSRSVVQNKPDVSMVRAIFGALTFPRPDEFQRGERAKYHYLYAYDFIVEEKSLQCPSP